MLHIHKKWPNLKILQRVKKLYNIFYYYKVSMLIFQVNVFGSFLLFLFFFYSRLGLLNYIHIKLIQECLYINKNYNSFIYFIYFTNINSLNKVLYLLKWTVQPIFYLSCLIFTETYCATRCFVCLKCSGTTFTSCVLCIVYRLTR